MRLNYAIVFVRDMKRSVAFYKDVLELPLKFETDEWSEFATEGATLALHATSGAGDGAPAPGRTPAGQCRPGLEVPDLDAFHERMKARSVPCLQEPRATSGVRIAQYADPDGLAISIAESRQGE